MGTIKRKTQQQSQNCGWLPVFLLPILQLFDQEND